ncbi:hypothetical protein [Fodinibius sp.]|uniref:hypothetical protein n=1 Tax=Fodinibius sp. TaxID=1872440 RepID=UPI002ACD6013|nr:hypothetical protein [Fodinibius sp.]MDZ7660745.1 hypothetical protein [Fodinibius sp.]
MDDIFEKNLPEPIFNKKVSTLLDEMFENLCGNRKVDFAGGLVEIKKQKKRSELIVVIDDTLKSKKV